ncbi:MAG TPA: TrpB-like pyridoxal phosphate-dependent enzyme [bacterium]|nr:TrpB-like pyridoxal phosphate-dependent enzyme [bacterium]HPG44714.1 TrpB-like pyridoxal phosphate-dependent enzyme [bacterium]HPM99114.1 TrpB-like pyridoxal phosphate-dependent enzyme [bacterium]
MERYRFLLDDQEMPRQWYNIAADLPPAPPPLGPDGKPLTPEQLAPVFPMNLIEQEVSTQRWIDIPQEVLDIYALWRPAPLYRAIRLEQALQTPARIYYKFEGASPAGSHKPNTAVAQAYYNKEFGIKRITTETGAGQWGCALAFACSLFHLECKVFMVRISFEQKPYRRLMMEAWGGKCVPSPSTETKAGRDILAQYPDTPGSLGMAISEAIEQAVEDKSGKTRYSLGSVLNHVLLHQTIVGLEAKKQLKIAGEKKVDCIIGCVGGGSNFAGISFPFVADKINGADIDIIPVEPSSCPTMTRAPFGYDHGDTAQMTPLLAMHSLGHNFVPAPIHAGGLRYHGVAPLISHVIRQKLATPRSIDQLECYAAAVQWARTEGFIPAPETSHAIAAAIQEAKKAKEEGKEKVILFNWSGHGLLDLIGYDKYFNGQLTNYSLPQEEIDAATEIMKKYPKPA